MKSLTATKVKKQASRLHFNPKTDPTMSIICEDVTTEFCTLRAIEALKTSTRDRKQNLLDQQQQSLILAGQLILTALANLEE